MLSQKRKILALHERIAVLDKTKEGRSCRSIAEDLGVSKTQIQEIVRNKKSIRQQWETGGRAERKYSKVRKLCYKDLDRVAWEWFTSAQAKNIPISGHMIQEQALMYAEQLGHSSFSGSNGWLDRWMKRHNVRLACLSGEAADGYDLNNVFNADETGLFYRALPKRSMVVEGEEAKGGRDAKERIAALLACSATGEKLTPLLIGRSANPRCSKGVTACLLSVMQPTKKHG
ncbi:tigger transposable element-derived protein 6-like [Corticium candelabrum]|uniref:tigger transposable element-derived protein 6-like n=1 Tax=Corticium candelabrum TaxID=121492 RepID=UPI002E25319B|nr:tigger transposable element-derived protein 6-like [Corticium candelabrum]